MNDKGHIWHTYNSLAGDRSVKATDKQKLIGYARKWNESKILLGCGLMHDLFETCAKLCKALQKEEVCIISDMKALLDTAKSVKAYQSMDFNNLPTVKRILSRMKVNAHEFTYQGAVVSGIAETQQSLARKKNDYAESITVFPRIQLRAGIGGDYQKLACRTLLTIPACRYSARECR